MIGLAQDQVSQKAVYIGPAGCQVSPPRGNHAHLGKSEGGPVLFD